ncbi:5-aminolevulinate synthase [Bradyrhizobium oligotrophicum S58]|uniref:5-aminolevulinate synthase n=1 Tax=Bradyrhizobium oligotrophicum S58 TaxID=1245469 RepID=M4Z7K2_9BRAD|nr:5-aminolevulinate synthase [Bradyrhizobium oligotrophicum S58]
MMRRGAMTALPGSARKRPGIRLGTAIRPGIHAICSEQTHVVMPANRAATARLFRCNDVAHESVLLRSSTVAAKVAARILASTTVRRAAPSHRALNAADPIQ